MRITHFLRNESQFLKISLFSASCRFGKMSFRRKVRSSYCPFDKMSVRLSVSAKCPFGKMSLGNVSFGKVSFGKMSGYQRIYIVRRAKHHRRRFLSGKILYTTNGISTFNMERKLLICGDVSSNQDQKEVIPSITAQNAVRRLDGIRMLLSVRTATLDFMLNVLKYLVGQTKTIPYSPISIGCTLCARYQTLATRFLKIITVNLRRLK